MSAPITAWGSVSTNPDLLTTNHGTIIWIGPLTARGRSWMYRHVPESHRAINRAVNAEHRYGIDILTAAIADGLTLQDNTTKRTA